MPSGRRAAAHAEGVDGDGEIDIGASAATLVALEALGEARAGEYDEAQLMRQDLAASMLQAADERRDTLESFHIHTGDCSRCRGGLEAAELFKLELKCRASSSDRVCCTRACGSSRRRRRATLCASSAAPRRCCAPEPRLSAATVEDALAP